MDELTEKMHATFFVDDETDRMHRVWAAMRAVNAGYPKKIEEALRHQQVTMADYEKHKDSYTLPG